MLMKTRTFFMAMMLLIPLLATGQEIKFMGLSFGTNVDVFCKALKAKGLKQTVDRFETKEFVGTFATYNDCRIIIKATEVSKKVRSAEVIFESVRDDEYERDKAFSEILKQYESKYGSKLKKEPYDKTTNDILGFTTYYIESGDIKINLNKTGPSVLSPDECSMSIYYYSKSLVSLKESNTKKHSSDI